MPTEPYIDKMCCPHCAVLIPPKSTLCISCGKELHSGLYVIISDGPSYAISFKGMVKIHGLTKDRAESLLTVLNKYLS